MQKLVEINRDIEEKDESVNMEMRVKGSEMLREKKVETERQRGRWKESECENVITKREKREKGTEITKKKKQKKNEKVKKGKESQKQGKTERDGG